MSTMLTLLSDIMAHESFYSAVIILSFSIHAQEKLDHIDYILCMEMCVVYGQFIYKREY